jgi:RsiW-degrading membrane proteinase PrsW (M82 family)
MSTSEPPVEGPAGDAGIALPPDTGGGVATLATLPPLPTQLCPHCSNVTPAGNFCGVCGAHLVHPDEKLAARRPHSFSANPDEPILRLSVVSSLFPHLSHRSSAPFRLGFALLVGLLVVFSATDLEAPVIALSAMGVPLLFQLYIYEVDVYEDSHIRLAALTLLGGAVLGLGWALIGGPIVSSALQPSLGSNLGGWKMIEAAVLVPIVGQALMLVPLVFVLVMMPNFGSKRESLDGFALGAASALGFTFAAIITNLADRLSDGVVSSRPFTSILTEAIIRGVANPVLAAAATGLIGASLWVRRSERGSVNASGRWLTSPLLILSTVLVIEVGLGFADQARLADIPLLAIHLAGAALVLLALRVGIHHILLHEQHDVSIGPSTTCAHCHHIVPSMPFCPSCGVAMVATSKRHRAGFLDVLPEADDATLPGAEPGWPTQAPGATVNDQWSGYPLAGTAVVRTHRTHQAYLLLLFVFGLTAICVALVLTAVTKAPDKTPVQRCHHGLCPGLSVGTAAAGSPVGPPVQVFTSPDGHFSVGLFASSLYRKISLGPGNAGLVSVVYQSDSVSGPNGTIQLGGGEIQVCDGQACGVSGGAGVSAEQVVNAIVSKDAPSATPVYPLPDALVGYQAGYGAVYDDEVNSSSGTQVEFRLVVMAAIRNGVPIVVFVDGPDDPSYPSSPFLDHPSFLDLDIDLGGAIDLMVNSIVWK